MSQVSNGDAGAAVIRLIRASRQHASIPDNEHWTVLEAASAEAMTAVLGNSPLLPLLGQIKELAGLDEAHRPGYPPPFGEQKGTVVFRAQQLRCALQFSIDALSEPQR